MAQSRELTQSAASNSRSVRYYIPQKKIEIKPSQLTNSMVESLLSDMDASKVMTDELGNIVPLQLNPYIISQYKFNDTISQRRLVKYVSDLTPESQESISKTLYAKGKEKTDIMNDKASLEPILSTDPKVRQKIRKKVMKEMGIISPDEEKDKFEETRNDQADEVDKKGDQNLTKAKGICQIAAQQQLNSGINQDMGIKIGQSPFAEVFSDPDRQQKRGEFSPFSSKTVPQMDIQSNINLKKGNKRVEIAKQLGIIIEEAESSDEDGEDLVFDLEVEQPGKEKEEAEHAVKQLPVGTILVKKKKKKAKRADRSIIEATEKKVEERRERGVSSAVVLGGGGGIGMGALKEKKARKQNPALTPNQRSLGDKNLNLYKSSVRKQMEGVLMGQIVDGEELGDYTIDENPDEIQDQYTSQRTQSEDGIPRATTTRIKTSDRQGKIVTIKDLEESPQKSANRTRRTQTSGTQRSKVPMMVTKRLEPGNSRALNQIDNEVEVEDASLQKYVHLGIASPSYSVTEFQTFMVKTQQETNKKLGSEISQDDDEKQYLMKQHNEKDRTELKFSRQMPNSGKFVMEVKKVIGGSSENQDLNMMV